MLLIAGENPRPLALSDSPVRCGAFIRGKRLIQSSHPGGGGGLLDTRRLFKSGCLLDHLW